MRLPRSLAFLFCLAAAFLLCLAASTDPARAQERFVYGTRSQAMGGTIVAAANDASAAFGNPAAFAFEHGWDMTVPLIVINLDVEGEVLASADAIQNDFDATSLNDIQTALDNGSVTQAQRAAALDAFLYRIPKLGSPGSGFSARASLGPAFRFKHWGFSAAVIGYAGISPVVDLRNGLSLGAAGFGNAIPSTPDNCGGNTFCQSFAATLVADSGGALSSAQAEQLVFDAGINRLGKDATAQRILRDLVTQTAAGGATLLSNRSGVDTRGILIEQYAFTYAAKVLGDRLAAGGSIKYLRGETFQRGFVVNDVQGGSDLLHDLRDRNNRQESSRFGIDAGVLWKPVSSLRLGLAGMNLNAPKFDYSNGNGSFKLDTLVRAGASWSRKGWLTVAGDLDLNEVDSQVVNGLKFRYGSLGAEFVLLKFLALRGGLYKNVAVDGSPLVYTGGVGFRFAAFELAFSGAISTKDEKIEASSPGMTANTIPSGAGFGFSFSWKSRKQK